MTLALAQLVLIFFLLLIFSTFSFLLVSPFSFLLFSGTLFVALFFPGTLFVALFFPAFPLSLIFLNHIHQHLYFFDNSFIQSNHICLGALDDILCDHSFTAFFVLKIEVKMLGFIIWFDLCLNSFINMVWKICLKISVFNVQKVSLSKKSVQKSIAQKIWI